MPIVTLITDWIQDDYYLGVFKGRLLSAYPDIKIVDISHKVPPFDSAKAGFILRNCYHHYPEGTIHIIGVNSEPSRDESLVVIYNNRHYFIGADNGIFGLIFNNEPDLIVRLTEPENYKSLASQDLFISAAIYILKNGSAIGLGEVAATIKKSIPRRASIDKDVIHGTIIYIDSYQNAITNITRELFERIGQNRQFEIAIQSNYYKLKKINKLYNETTPGELLALFNSIGLLEIAINKGNAAELLNLGTGSTVRIKFFDKIQSQTSSNLN